VRRRPRNSDLRFVDGAALTTAHRTLAMASSRLADWIRRLDSEPLVGGEA
jgi:hypothetical protein